MWGYDRSFTYGWQFDDGEIWGQNFGKICLMTRFIDVI